MKKCAKALHKKLKAKNESTQYELRYLYANQSAPLIHVFAVYKVMQAELIDIVEMVKLKGRKCSEY